MCWGAQLWTETITLVGPSFEGSKIVCDGGWFDRPSFGDVFLIIDPPCHGVILREEQIGGQPPIPTITLVIPPTTVKVFHLVDVPFDDPSPLNRSPERLVPPLPQLPLKEVVVTHIRRSDECTVGLDGPIEIVFGDPPNSRLGVVDILNQLPETRVRVLDRLSEVRPVVVEVLIRGSGNDHPAFTPGRSEGSTRVLPPIVWTFG